MWIPTSLVCLCLLRCGFLRAVLLVLRCKEGSAISAGPPCGSFVFLNSFTSGRTPKTPLGYARLRDYVRNANRTLFSIQCQCCVKSKFLNKLSMLDHWILGFGFLLPAKDHNTPCAIVATSHSPVLLSTDRATTEFCDDIFPLHHFLPQNCGKNPGVAPCELVTGLICNALCTSKTDLIHTMCWIYLLKTNRALPHDQSIR